MTLESDPLIVKWIDKLGLQEIPIKVRRPFMEIDWNGLHRVSLTNSNKGFVIELSKNLFLYSSLHKLGYIFIAKSSGELESLKESLSIQTQEDLRLQSCFFDCTIENYFRKIDKEYKKARELQVFTHSASYYGEWFNSVNNNSIIDICYIYISDYLNFLHNMPERFKIKLYKTITGRFNKTRNLMLKKAKKKCLEFTKDDLVKIHDLLNKFELKLDYDYLISNIDILKTLLSELRPVIIWN